MASTEYLPRRPSESRFATLRHHRMHLRTWAGTVDAPLLVLVHGWMDVGASFQFLVDALEDTPAAGRTVVAPDWRGYGLTEGAPTDSYWFADYLGDLDAMLDHLSPAAPVDLVGHSMGGNVAMLYAGVRPGRVRRLVNLEGFGMPQTEAAQAPQRLRQWLDELKAPARLRDYASHDEVAARLVANNPRLAPDRARWLALHWARPDAQGRWQVLGDPAHKRVNPVLSRREEAIATWQAIEAPVLWVEGDLTDTTAWWGDRYPRSDFEARLSAVRRLERAVLSPSGHMLHLDQAETLAGRIARFVS